jgi:hypothetical protein
MGASGIEPNMIRYDLGRFRGSVEDYYKIEDRASSQGHRSAFHAGPLCHATPSVRYVGLVVDHKGAWTYHRSHRAETFWTNWSFVLRQKGVGHMLRQFTGGDQQNPKIYATMFCFDKGEIFLITTHRNYVAFHFPDAKTRVSRGMRDLSELEYFLSNLRKGVFHGHKSSDLS